MGGNNADSDAVAHDDDFAALRQPLLPQHDSEASVNVSKPIEVPSIPPKLFALHFLLTFAQNLPTVSIGLLLVNTLHWSTSQLTWYWTLLFVPWMARPLYAYLSDRAIGVWISRSKRRRFYIIIGNLLSIVGTLVQTIAIVAFVMSRVKPSSSRSLTFSDVFVGVGGVVLNIGLAMSSAANDALGVEYGNWCVRQHRQQLAVHAQGTSSYANDMPPRVGDGNISDTEEAVTEQLVQRISVQPMVAPPPAPAHATTPMLEEDNSSAAHTLKAAVQSQCMLARTYGSLTSAAFSILLTAMLESTFDTLGVYMDAAFLTLAVYCAVFIVARLYNEDNYLDAGRLVPSGQPAHSAKPAVWHQLLLPHWPTLLFLFLYNSIPSSDDAWFTYLYDERTTTLTPTLVAAIAFISTIGSVVGIKLYQRTVLNVSLVRIVIIGTIASALVNCSKAVVVQHLNRTLLHLPDSLYIPLQTLITSIVSTFTVIPQLVFSTIHIASDHAQYEALIYSSFQCVQHLGTLVSSSVAAGVTGWYSIGVNGQYEMLSGWIAVCSFASLVPLLILPYLTSKGRSSVVQ